MHPASYKKAGVRARRAWSRAMRAAHGNTAATPPAMQVAWWNTRALAAAGGKEASKKEAWLLAALEERQPAVVVLFEVLGGMVEFRRLRKRLRGVKYTAAFLPGEGVGQRNGIVVAAHVGQAQLRTTKRVAERTIAVTVSGKGEEEDTVITGMHGVTSEDGELRATARFKAQLNGATRHCTEAMGLLVGDLNYVPCRRWRRAGGPLNEGDKALRQLTGWRCACCRDDQVADGATAWLVGGDDGVGTDVTQGWTRFATRDGTWGEPTSRIDVALAFGAAQEWRLAAHARPECTVEGRSDGLRAISDHMMQFVERAWRGSNGVEREKRRLAPKLDARGAGAELAGALKEALGGGAELRGEMEAGVMMAKATGKPAADAVMQALRTTIDTAQTTVNTMREARRRAAEGPRGGLASPKRRERMYAARLKEVAALRRGRVRAVDARWACVLHPSTGMAKYIAAHGDGWDLIVRKCRLEMEQAQRQRRTADEAEAKRVAALAEQWVALPANAEAERQKIGFAMIRKPRAGATLSRMRRRDTASGELVSALAVDAADVMREIGEINVAKSDDGAVVPGFEAWHEKFIGQWPKLRGADGRVFSLRKEITFKRFRSTVYAMPNKAAGISGVSVAILKALDVDALRVVYDAIMHDAEVECASERWHKVVYVLLEKPAPNDPEIVGERREIALTEHDVKVLLQAVRRTCYARLLGRTRAQNLGWIPGFGCGDVAQASGWLTQQSRLLGSPLYMLYADLAQFFPRVHRGCLHVAELAHGLPVEVARLAALVYGRHADDPNAARCVYDSEGGFGGEYVNGQGTLMGCPLSTDRARLFLNSIVVAIELTAKGVPLWNSAEADGTWRRISQLMCADDWLGCFEDVGQLRAAWALWTLWEPITGAKVGIKAADKTVLTGVTYDEQGRPQAVIDPGLRTVDGRAVPVRPPSYAYKHLGHWRRADASDLTARTKFRASTSSAIKRIRQMPRSVTRSQLMTVSDALLGGSACFYLAGTYVTFEEADKIEARWRAVFNNKTRRARDTPRAELYRDTWVPGVTRRHIYAHGLTAIYSAVNAAMSDAADLEHRAAARSGLDLGFYRWGCRSDPRTWDFTHLRHELEAALADPTSPRYFADAWMLAAIILRAAPCEADEDVASNEAAAQENWRWAGVAPVTGPLTTGAMARARDGTTATIAASGAPPRRQLLHAGYVRLGHLCKMAGGTPAWKTYEEARRESKWLADGAKARKAWQETVSDLRRKGVKPCPPERPRSARDVWAAATVRASPFEARTAPAAVQLEKVASTAAALHAARQRGAWQVDRSAAGREEVAKWRAMLDECTATPPPNPTEWAHGVANAADHAEGAHVVFELGKAAEASGGQARWLARHDLELDEDGRVRGWEQRAAELEATYEIDDEGYLARCGGGRVLLNEVDALPVMLQFVARARWALGDVPVIDVVPDKTAKSEVTRVNLQAAHASLRAAIRLQAQYDPTHAAAVDGTKATKTGASGDEYTVIARAAVLHDGRVIGGKVTEDDAFLSEQRTTYLAEKAATDDVLTDLPEGSRVVLWLDSTSPQHALARFRRSPARRKGQFHFSGRHAATCALLERHEVVVYHWQMSHVGDPANEWADTEADKVAEAEEPLPLALPSYGHTSMLFPRDQASPRNWAARRADAHVAEVVRRTSQRTVYSDARDIRPQHPAPRDDTVIPKVRAERGFHSDAGHHWSTKQAERRRKATCPWGCRCACTWMHFTFECTGAPMVERQQRYAETVADARAVAEPVVGHEQLTTSLSWLAAKLAWPGAVGNRWRQPSEPAEQWDTVKLREARRLVCGHVRSTGCEVHNRKRELREAVSEVAAAGAALMETAAAACADKWTEEIRLGDLTGKVMGKYARHLQARVRRGGPRRAGRLRAIDAIGRQVQGQGATAVDGWTRNTRTWRSLVHSGGTPEAGILRPDEDWRPWFLLARLTWWRLRTWDKAGLVEASGEWSGEAVRAWTKGDLGDAAVSVVTSRRALVERATAAAKRGIPPANVRAKCKRRGEEREARAVAERPIRAWQGGLSVRGEPLQAVGATIHVDCGGGRARRGQKRRARAARARAIARGSAADDEDAWEVESIVEVRRCPTRGGLSLEALIRWVSPDPEKPWEDSWRPVTAYWIPDRAMRSDIRARWAAEAADGSAPGARAAGGGGALNAHAAGEASRPAASRVDGEAWVFRRPRKRTRGPYARLECDVDRSEEAELRRLEGVGEEGEEVMDVEECEAGVREAGRDDPSAPAASSGAAVATTAGGELEAHLAARQAADKKAAETMARVHAAMAVRMDTGIRVNHALVRQVRGKRTLGEVTASGGDEAAPSGRPEGGGGGGARADQGGAPPRRLRTVRHDDPKCQFCECSLTGTLCGHEACVAEVLGWKKDTSCGGRATELAALCASPCPAAVSRLLTEVDVMGDGSCWNYVLALWHGKAPHAVTAMRRPRRSWLAGTQVSNETMRISMDDRVADCALRRHLGKRMRSTRWAAQHAQVFEAREQQFRVPTVAEAEHAVHRIEYCVPVGGLPGEGWPRRMGAFGGDSEYAAAADALGLAIVTMVEEQRDGQSGRMRLFMAAPDGAPARLGSSGGTTVDAAVRRCLQQRWALRFAMHQPTRRHWHAMTPIDSAGRVVTREAALGKVEGWSAENGAALRQWLQAYDAGGGYSTRVSAESGAG